MPPSAAAADDAQDGRIGQRSEVTGHWDPLFQPRLELDLVSSGAKQFMKRMTIPMPSGRRIEHSDQNRKHPDHKPYTILPRIAGADTGSVVM